MVFKENPKSSPFPSGLATLSQALAPDNLWEPALAVGPHQVGVGA